MALERLHKYVKPDERSVELLERIVELLERLLSITIDSSDSTKKTKA